MAPIKTTLAVSYTHLDVYKRQLYDRVTLGYVVDFLNFHYQQHYWPAFNVADSAIVVGVGLLMLDSFKKPQT